MSIVTSGLLNVQEAASFLRVRCSTIYAWVHRREIPYRKHGRRLIFSAIDLESWSLKNACTPFNAVSLNDNDVIPRSIQSPRKGPRSLTSKIVIAAGLEPCSTKGVLNGNSSA